MDAKSSVSANRTFTKFNGIGAEMGKPNWYVRNVVKRKRCLLILIPLGSSASGGLTMEELVEIINLAMEQFKYEYGDDAKLEDGDEIVTVLNNCALIVSLENGELKTRFIGGKPYYIDRSLSIYRED